MLANRQIISFMLCNILFIGILQSIILFPLNAQNSSFQVFKFQIENYAKQFSQLKNEDGQTPIIVENVGKKNSYVFKELDIVFMIDTMVDAYINYYYPQRKDPYSIPMTQYLLGSNKVQFYGYHTQYQILYDLNNDTYTQIQFQPTDTLIRWKNKNEATFFSGQCEISKVQKSYLFVPMFSFVFSKIYPRVIKSPKHRIEWVTTFYLKDLPFKEQMEEIKNKLNNISSLPSEKLKAFHFKNYFIPESKEIIPSLKEHKK